MGGLTDADRRVLDALRAADRPPDKEAFIKALAAIRAARITTLAPETYRQLRARLLPPVARGPLDQAVLEALARDFSSETNQLILDASTQSPDRDTRIKALTLLSPARGPEMEAKLLGLMEGEPDPPVAAAVASWLSRCYRQSVETRRRFRELSACEELPKRRLGVWGLQVRDSEEVRLLARSADPSAFVDTDDEIRCLSLSRLAEGARHDALSLAAARRAVTADPSPDVRQAGISALEALYRWSGAGREELIELLRFVRSQDPDEWVRHKAENCLGSLGR
ncbi:MAG: hypothetical protein L0216_07830 [Planctomycetales bacterium]|nr:hypothetical protein [Planctomycetales bacterium]